MYKCLQKVQQQSRLRYDSYLKKVLNLISHLNNEILRNKNRESLLQRQFYCISITQR